MALNVNRNVTDPFYRYKMPKLQAKVEGRGNGIKTVISNMTDIAKALERPPMYPTKYFGCELGTNTNFDAKNDRYIVNGEHDANKLQDILDGFIKKFVLCPACENPETHLAVHKGLIRSKCKACGHAFSIDNKHKLSTYIAKNPPKVNINYEKAEKKAIEKVDKAAENNDSIDNGKGSSNDDEEDDWEPEPVENLDKLDARIGRLVIDKDLDKTEEQRLDMLHNFFVNAKEKNELTDAPHQALLVNEAQRLELKQKAALLLANVIFDENILAEKQIPKNRSLLLRFVLEDKKAQRYLLGGIEQVIAKHENLLMAKSAHVIKALYDNDICEEEALLNWGDKPSSKYVSKSLARKIIENAQPVLTWLREAEEESEDDSDDEINFDNEKKESEVLRKQREDAEKKAKAPAAATVPVGEDEDEIDIDDI